VERSGRRELLISKNRVQTVLLVVPFGFFVFGLLAYRTYTGQPPIVVGFLAGVLLVEAIGLGRGRGRVLPLVR
jgi:hypothetical protein